MRRAHRGPGKGFGGNGSFPRRPGGSPAARRNNRPPMSETFEVLTAEEASADVFLSTSAMSPYQEQLRDYLGSLLRQGCTRLDWCLVALDAGRPVARVA